MGNKMGMILMLVLSLGFVGCQGDERIGEVSKKQLEADKSFQDNLAREMETDLDKRFSFYEAVSGTFEGTVQVSETEKYKIKIKLVPSIPLFRPDRVRRVEEVINDLNMLNYHIQITHWNPDSQYGVMGCKVSGIRPDMTQGLIEVSSPDCPSFYELRIGDGNVNPQDSDQINRRAAEIARAALNHEPVSVKHLTGTIYPMSSSAGYKFVAERTE